ncbi:MAG: ATP-binding cassette domain-containing protein, partial [Pseudomonadota bacterium]
MAEPGPGGAEIIALPPRAPAAVLRDVEVRRGGARLLDGTTLALSPTGITVVLGPNGAGKSLLLRVLAGLVTPDAGTLQMRTEHATGAALVFQRPVLLRRSARGNLMHALALAGVSRRDRAGRARALLAAGGLSALAERPARALSGGEQQRLGLVRALAADPALLLLDEPTASVDPASTHAIETLVRAAAEAGTKVVLVTHDQGQ